MDRVDACDLAVIGAGPAGSALAARVAAAGWRVVLLERSAFPRDKLCGEFLSPESHAYLTDLGLERAVAAAAPAGISHLRISMAGGRNLLRELPAPGRGLSRRTLDLLLSDRAREAGAEFRTRHHVRSVRESAGGGAGLARAGLELRIDHQGSPRLLRARAVADASGLAGGFSGETGLRQPSAGRRRPEAARAFVAIQTHLAAASDPGAGVVELYPFDGGYCGLNHVEGGRLTLCALASHARWKRGGAARPAAFIAAVARENPRLGERLRGLDVATDRWLAASGGLIGPGRAARRTARLLAIGDAAAMIAPACGDGISMALRSAELASRAMLRYLAGEHSWEECVRRVDDDRRREFAGRLRVGRWIHEALVRPGAGRLLVEGAAAFPPLTAFLFRRSRDARAWTPTSCSR